jgi:putative addiction module killer protein
MESLPRTIEYYVDSKGKVHFADWLAGLDANTRARINTRLKKVEGGNLGDHHAEGSGVFALIFDLGPGYRVYFGLADEKKVVLLLSGGDKKRQNQDIHEAIRLWEEYKTRKAKEEKDKKKG